ncbi:MAG: DUF5677 domain-containing protein [Eubacteriales bacterium]
MDLLTRLNSYCIMLTKASMQLIWPGFVWQAEILERSLLEGTIKLIYMAIDPKTVEAKAQEFANTLSDIYQFKRRKDLKDYLDNLSVDNEVLKDSYQKIIDCEVKLNLNRKERKEIERRWSLNEMTRKIDEYSIEGFEKLKYFQAYYATASHITHVDINCRDLIWDRDKRNSEEKQSMTSDGLQLLS